MWFQVKLKVYSEEDSRNSRYNPDDTLLTSKTPVRAFGQYVEELHAHTNRGFREQFYVSGRPTCGGRGFVLLATPTLLSIAIAQ